MSKELFVKKEQAPRALNRPLGEVSDFVVEKLPTALAQFREGLIPGEQLIAKVAAILEQLTPIKVDQLLSTAVTPESTCYIPNQQLDLAALDLKMLEVALVQSQLPVPERLTQLVETFSAATHQLPMISYEDLIYINPLHNDPRTFTTGEIGSSERDFYEGHRRIEEKLEEVINRLLASINTLQNQADLLTLDQQLSLAITAFQEVFIDMTAVTLAMPKDHFAGFRGYLTSHPTRELKGPSGAFTAMIPVIDMLLGGEQLDQKYFKFLQENESYFPRQGRHQIADAYQKIQNRQTLNALVENMDNPPVIAKKLDVLSSLVKKFRGYHYRGVNHQIPGITTGTAGEDIGTFLRGRMKINHIQSSITEENQHEQA